MYVKNNHFQVINGHCSLYIHLYNIHARKQTARILLNPRDVFGETDNVPRD